MLTLDESVGKTFHLNNMYFFLLFVVFLLTYYNVPLGSTLNINVYIFLGLALLQVFFERITPEQ